MIARAQEAQTEQETQTEHRGGLGRYTIPALKREGALVLFVAATVMIGTVGKPLELSGTLEACRLLSFEERLGYEVSGARPGIA